MPDTPPERRGFTKERHDILLALSLLKSFAFGFNKLSSELVDLVTILP